MTKYVHVREQVWSTDVVHECMYHIFCRVAGLEGRVRKNKKRRPDRWLRWRTPFWVRSWTNKPEQDVGVYVLVYQKLSINPQLNLSTGIKPICIPFGTLIIRWCQALQFRKFTLLVIYSCLQKDIHSIKQIRMSGYAYHLYDTTYIEIELFF